MSKTTTPLDRFGTEVERQAARRKHFLRGEPGTVWFGLSTSGLIGWTIAVPAVLGAFIGHWLDKHHHQSYSWTLALLAAGLVFGCWNAWNWVATQAAKIDSETSQANE